MSEYSEPTQRVTEMMVLACRRRLWKLKVADSLGTELTGGKLLAGSLALRRHLASQVLGSDERNVGVLLPPSAGAVLCNAALALDGRVAVNLNYSVSVQIINHCIEQAGIRHVLTSRQFLRRALRDSADQLKGQVVLLEELRKGIGRGARVRAFLDAFLLPGPALIRKLRLRQADWDDPLTIIFTSGSTGVPKGVVLTHRNVASQIQAVQQVIRLRPSDVLVGVLPFFHSFGYTITMWTVLGLDVGGVYHYSPLEAEAIGELCRKYGGTILLATPTFLRRYIRRCTPEHFKSLEVVVAGAEKLPKDVCDAFEEKFGIRPVEGYGTTELSPLVSVNIPPARHPTGETSGWKEGTVGRPVPGVQVRVVDPDSFQDLEPGQPGMLLVKGPNVMKGYLNRPDLTAEVIRDGWYITGDIARIDSDGFITITGRQSRFSKIGGEMVPHVEVEEKLNALIGLGPEGELRAVVTAVPDERKGERLVVLHLPLEQPVDELRKKLLEELPPIYVPSADSFRQVDQIPILPSGKLDLKRVQQLAAELFGVKTE